MSEIYRVPESCSFNVNCEECYFKKAKNGAVPLCFGRKGIDVKFVSVQEVAKLFAAYGLALQDCVTRTQLIIYLAIQGFLPGRLEHLDHFQNFFPDKERDYAILCLGASFDDDGTHWAGIDTRFLAVREHRVQ